MSRVSNSEGILVCHYSHFHTSPCPSWDQIPSLHPARRCWLDVCPHPMIRILYAMQITFILYETISKKTKQSIYDMKVAIWQKCIHAYPYFWCQDFILSEFLLASGLIYCTPPSPVSPKAWACLGEVKSLFAWLLCDQPLTSYRFILWSFATHTWILIRVLHLGDVVILQIVAEWSVDRFLYVVRVVSNASHWSPKAKPSCLAYPRRPLNIASLHCYCKMINMPHQN